MIAGKTRTCQNCGIPIEGDNRRQKFCSNGCRQNHFRARHGIAVPTFLQPKAQRRVVERTTQVVKKVVSPHYQQLTDQKKAIETKISVCEAHRRRIINEQARILASNDELSSGLATAAISTGAIVGVAILGILLAANTKDKEEKKKLMYITALVAMGAALFTAVLSHLEVKKGVLRRKAAKMERLKQEADEYETKALTAGAELAALNALADQTPKHVEQSEDVTHYEQELDNSERLTTLSELAAKTFDTLPMGTEYVKLIGEPERNFSMALHGPPGNGKSTFAINLAKDLGGQKQRVLFVAAEEGFSKSLQQKWKNHDSDYVTLANCRNISSLRDSLKRNSFDAVFLDSVQELKIKPEQLKNLRMSYSKTAFIYVLQATKAGNFKGSNEYAHDADVVLKIESRKPSVEKTRYL